MIKIFVATVNKYVASFLCHCQTFIAGIKAFIYPVQIQTRLTLAEVKVADRG